MRKVSVFVLVAVFAALVAAVSPSKASAKDLRWHGVLVRVSEDGSTLTVRKGNVEKAIHVNADTKYTKAEGNKAVDIEKSDIKEGDDLICIGKDEKGDFVATRVDKRLPR